MHSYGTTYASVKMAKLVVILILFAHWQACLWGLGAQYMAMAGKDNWATEFEEMEKDRGMTPELSLSLSNYPKK